MNKKINANLLLDLFNQPTTMLSLSIQQWQSVIFILRDCQMLARLCLLAKQAKLLDKLPDYTQHHMKNAEIYATKQKHQIEYEAQQLQQAIGPEETYAIYLKGAAYSLTGNKAGEGRTYSDIDLLVKKDKISNIERSLNLWGWLGTNKDDYNDKYYREWTHEIPPLQHGSRATVLDLHHNFVPPISGKAPNTEAFIKNAVSLPNGFTVLSPSAMTLHSAIHLFFNEEFNNGFRDMYDLHCLFTEYGHNEFWDEIVTLAMTSNFHLELALAVTHCQKMFGTKIPEHKLLNQLIAGTNNQMREWLFEKSLLPHHPLLVSPFQGTANALLLVRGHILKMPMGLLVKHTLFKTWRGINSFLLGKGYHLEEQNKLD